MYGKWKRAVVDHLTRQFPVGRCVAKDSSTKNLNETKTNLFSNFCQIAIGELIEIGKEARIADAVPVSLLVPVLAEQLNAAWNVSFGSHEKLGDDY